MSTENNITIKMTGKVVVLFEKDLKPTSKWGTPGYVPGWATDFNITEEEVWDATVVMAVLDGRDFILKSRWGKVGEVKPIKIKNR